MVEKDNLLAFNELLSYQGKPKDVVDGDNNPNISSPLEKAETIQIHKMKQKREAEYKMYPEIYPKDYFFSALAELILDE